MCRAFKENHLTNAFLTLFFLHAIFYNDKDQKDSAHAKNTVWELSAVLNLNQRVLYYTIFKASILGTAALTEQTPIRTAVYYYS